MDCFIVSRKMEPLKWSLILLTGSKVYLNDLHLKFAQCCGEWQSGIKLHSVMHRGASEKVCLRNQVGRRFSGGVAFKTMKRNVGCHWAGCPVSPYRWRMVSTQSMESGTIHKANVCIRTGDIVSCAQPYELGLSDHA